MPAGWSNFVLQGNYTGLNTLGMRKDFTCGFDLSGPLQRPSLLEKLIAARRGFHMQFVDMADIGSGPFCHSLRSAWGLGSGGHGGRIAGRSYSGQ